VGVLLTDPADFAGLNEEHARWFPSEPPTRYIAKLGIDLPRLLVSIRMTAFVGNATPTSIHVRPSPRAVRVDTSNSTANVSATREELTRWRRSGGLNGS